MTFQRWMEEVDEICMRTYCMSIHDLPDMCFYDAYQDGLTPEEFMADTIPDMECLGQLILS